MAQLSKQQLLKFNDYTPIQPDSDGYQLAFATTSTSNSGRTMRGNMWNTPLFTVEAYNLKWTNIKASEASKILNEVMGRSSFNFYHYNIYRNRWENGEFYVANVNSPIISLKDGKEKVSELSFQVTAINPL